MIIADKDTETEIMRDAWKFLNDYSDAPPMDSDAADRYFDKVSQRMTSLLKKYEGRSTKLTEKVLIALFEYLEYKSYLRTTVKDGKDNGGT